MAGGGSTRRWTTPSARSTAWATPPTIRSSPGPSRPSRVTRSRSRGSCGSSPPCPPTWDTAWAAAALHEAGAHEATDRALDWLLPRQGSLDGDWAVRAGGIAPGGWSFEYENAFYPDTDDTIAILTLLALRGRHREGPAADRFRRGLAWLEHMQGRSGGFAAFDRDLDRESLNDIPFADLKALLDPDCVDLTGRALELLGRLGRGANDPSVRRGLDFLRTQQRNDGSFPGRWGVHFLYGTWAAIVGAVAVGIPTRTGWLRAAVDWLRSVQNPDGSFGESCTSYDLDRYVPLDQGTPSQTAWALLALLAAAGPDDPAVRRAGTWLIRTQRTDGGWDEPHFTGTGFPRHFYLRYRLYRDVFPTLALATWARRAGILPTEPT